MPYAEVCTIAASPGFLCASTCRAPQSPKEFPVLRKWLLERLFLRTYRRISSRTDHLAWEHQLSPTSPKQARSEEPSKHGGGMRPERRLEPQVVVIALLTLPQCATA